MGVEEKKIIRSNKLFPLFSGLTADLLFWAAINTLFLTNVKGFTSAQISFLVSFGLVSTILFQPLSYKIIKKIGNINSVKLGTVLLFLGSFMITFSKQYYLIVIGESLYELAFLFKNMDSVILKNNLKYMKQEKEFLDYQSKASMVYSVVTMIISFAAGVIFNLNNYLPMILCTVFCFCNMIFSNFLYEVPKTEELKQKKKSKKSFKASKLVMFLFILFAFSYSIIDLGQSNSKLLLLYNMNEIMSYSQVALILSLIIAISRVVRVFSNYLFPRLLKKNDKNVLSKLIIRLALADFIIIIGNFIPLKVIGIGLIAIGFFTFLALRDPLQNYIRTMVLDNCDVAQQEKAINYLTLSLKLGKFLISVIITIILLRYDVVYAIFLMLVIAILDLLLCSKINKLLVETR